MGGTLQVLAVKLMHVHYKNRRQARQTVKTALEIQSDSTNRALHSRLFPFGLFDLELLTLLSPAMHGAIKLSINRQIRPLVGILRRLSLIYIHAQPGGVSRMHHPVRKTVFVPEHLI